MNIQEPERIIEIEPQPHQLPEPLRPAHEPVVIPEEPIYEPDLIPA
jgi:hypothetical protein